MAECTIDNCWYRAEILDVRRADDFLEMTLIFVDYGSTDYISDAAKYVDMYHSGFSLVRTDPGKVWNSNCKFCRSGKSWKMALGMEKSWKV